jgi:EAL domain-containing protein (putative c-di-GMP-specific phosphodiesterase class I)
MHTAITLMDICNGLLKKEFIFYYQPLYSLITGHICGAEALIRWIKPDGTLVMPAEFIPLAEEKDIITEISQEMYPRLIDDLASIAELDDSLTVYFNLTGKDLENADLVPGISACLAEKGLNPKMFGVEIVESVLMPPNPKIRQTIFDFAERGHPVVLNDFSAGNTTLNYLSQLPLSAIKLSMNIVKRAPLSRMDFRVLRHLISMGHQLRLDVIAEGVEDDELYNLILSTGCTAAQGFYFSYPLPLNEFLDVLRKRPRWLNYPFGLEYLAQIDHIDFRRDAIREALIIFSNRDEDIRERALARLPLLEHTDCLLGEWYYGIGQEWSSSPGFEELGKVHYQFHQTAKTLLDAAQNNEKWESISQLIEELEHQSREITLHLHKFAITGLLEHYKPGN